MHQNNFLKKIHEKFGQDYLIFQASSITNNGNWNIAKANIFSTHGFRTHGIGGDSEQAECATVSSSFSGLLFKIFSNIVEKDFYKGHGEVHGPTESPRA